MSKNSWKKIDIEVDYNTSREMSKKRRERDMERREERREHHRESYGRRNSIPAKDSVKFHNKSEGSRSEPNGQRPNRELVEKCHKEGAEEEPVKTEGNGQKNKEQHANHGQHQEQDYWSEKLG